MKKISTKEAFTKIESEITIPINTRNHKFEFTRRWFRQRNQRTWSTFFPKKFLWRGRKPQPIKMIQIGVFEGMDLVWCFQNILQYPASRVVAIDPWAATRKLDAECMENVYERAVRNLQPWRRQLKIVRGLSHDILSDIIVNGILINDISIVKESVDLIVIDGDHNAPAVTQDAMDSLLLLKKGGWMVFDDVRNRSRKKHHVFEGLSDFIETHGDKVKLVWQHNFSDCYQKK